MARWLGCHCDCEKEEESELQSEKFADFNYLKQVSVLNSKREPGFSTFLLSHEQPLLGVPLQEGTLWHLSSQELRHAVSFSLYVNGFAFRTADGMEASVTLNPFALVRNCRFQSGAYQHLKSFKVALCESDPCCYFAVQSECEREAEEQRSRWVLGLSHAILLISDSLKPSIPLCCDPLPGVPTTKSRLLAGYLLHKESPSLLSALYCELSAPRDGIAEFTMYDHEDCDVPVGVLTIHETTVCLDCVGINSCCFLIDNHNFAAQSPSERKLWLRALSNVKVKIQNKAPSASDDMLVHYRTSIRSYVQDLESTSLPSVSNDPLLTRGPRSTRLGDSTFENDSDGAYPPSGELIQVIF
mmetsp:Transcript_63242/g.150845  ORF Transcript_63242/g.150845 Transcript_63242/m.150845 type:complete len:356 (-) Transcript_63242:86-1153(-)